jgi:hypothetical protein
MRALRLFVRERRHCVLQLLRLLGEEEAKS